MLYLKDFMVNCNKKMGVDLLNSSFWLYFILRFDFRILNMDFSVMDFDSKGFFFI